MLELLRFFVFTTVFVNLLFQSIKVFPCRTSLFYVCRAHCRMSSHFTLQHKIGLDEERRRKSALEQELGDSQLKTTFEN